MEAKPYFPPKGKPMNTQNTPVIVAKAFFDSNVRTLVIGDSIWMHCGDVATALGYARPDKAMQEWMPTRKAVGAILSENSCPPQLGGADFSTEIGHNNWKATSFIDEESLYDMLMDCHAPEAKQFRKWVVSDVLPSIRKTGQYSTQQEPYVELPESKEAITALLLDEVDKSALLLSKVANELRQSIARENELATQLGYNGYYTQAQIRECNSWMGNSKVHVALNVLSARAGYKVRHTQNYGTSVQYNMYAVEVWEAYAASLRETLVLPPDAERYVSGRALNTLDTSKPKPALAVHSPTIKSNLRSKLPSMLGRVVH